MQLELCLVQGVILTWPQLKSESVWTCAMWHASLNGIDRYTASSLLYAGGISLLIGPGFNRFDRRLGFVLARRFCWRWIGRMTQNSHPSKHDSSAESRICLTAKD